MRKAGVMIVIAIIVLGIIWVAYGYLSVRGIEQPKYSVLKKSREYEIREYDPFLTAEVVVEGRQKESLSRGFKILFDYISGRNIKQESITMTAPVMQETAVQSERIAMTAPVLQLQGEGSYRVSFMMPSRYSADTIPRPEDPAVKIVQAERKKVAVLQFAGYATEETINKKQERLNTLLQEDGHRILSSFQLAVYNPPWTPPFMRRNEIIVEIQ